MRGVLVVVVLCSIGYSKALECGISKVNSEDVKKTLSTCIKNNETLERIWEMASSSATPTTDSSDSSSMEDDQPQVQNARMTRVVKRASNAQPTEEQDKSTPQPDSTTPSHSESAGDACIVQCVFKQMGMTDDNGLPDHSKIVEGLLKNVTGRELSIFLQEAAGECFQQMDEEKNTDSCVYSTQLVSCLANKGRMNCEDWPAGNLPF